MRVMTKLLPLASEPYIAPTDRDMLPSERREFVRTHRTCIFGYGRRDDGLMVGTVNLVETLELLFQIVRKGFDGVIYFDTFPDITGMDPVQECGNNIAMVNALWEVAKRLANQTDLLEAIERQDAVVSQNLIRRAVLGM